LFSQKGRKKPKIVTEIKNSYREENEELLIALADAVVDPEIFETF
jgi:hypothetical protein